VCFHFPKLEMQQAATYRLRINIENFVCSFEVLNWVLLKRN
jgi:hypothetical protein